MNGIDRTQLYSALILVVMVLFVSSGYRPVRRWARPLRRAAIALFVIAVAAALVEIAVWLLQRGG